MSYLNNFNGFSLTPHPLQKKKKKANDNKKVLNYHFKTNLQIF